MKKKKNMKGRLILRRNRANNSIGTQISFRPRQFSSGHMYCGATVVTSSAMSHTAFYLHNLKVSLGGFHLDYILNV